jgi:hypothetical protein
MSSCKCLSFSTSLSTQKLLVSEMMNRYVKGLLIGLTPLIWFPFANHMTVAPYGSEIFLHLSMIPILGGVLALIAIPISAIGLISAKSRRMCKLLIVICVVLVIGTFVGAKLGNMVRMNAFYRLAIRSKPLVATIQQYSNDEGHPPASLQNLVPKYLSEIPTTRMGAYPKFEYKCSKTPEQFSGNPWILSVPCPIGMLNWDEFFYFPQQNYPTVGYGGHFRRLGVSSRVNDNYYFTPLEFFFSCR